MLTAASEASNSIDHPGDVLPAISQFPCPQPTFNYTLPANSIGVLRLKAR
jgi:hypothetical protein